MSDGTTIFLSKLIPRLMLFAIKVFFLHWLWYDFHVLFPSTASNITWGQAIAVILLYHGINIKYHEDKQ